MPQILKNIFLFVVCIGVIVVGYYTFFAKSETDSAGMMGENEAVRQELINKTEAFIERSNKLQQVSIDPAFFTDPAFVSLRSFSSAVPNQPVGRIDIFSDPEPINNEPSQSSE